MPSPESATYNMSRSVTSTLSSLDPKDRIQPPLKRGNTSRNVSTRMSPQGHDETEIYQNFSNKEGKRKPLKRFVSARVKFNAVSSMKDVLH